MGLYARFAGTEPPSLPVHRFSSLCGEWATGDGIITRAKVIERLGLNAEAIADLDLIQAKYNSFGNTTAGQINKSLYLFRIERCGIAAQNGDMNEQEWRASLGIGS